jgi:hypothetical protein
MRSLVRDMNTWLNQSCQPTPVVWQGVERACREFSGRNRATWLGSHKEDVLDQEEAIYGGFC